MMHFNENEKLKKLVEEQEKILREISLTSWLIGAKTVVLALNVPKEVKKNLMKIVEESLKKMRKELGW